MRTFSQVVLNTSDKQKAIQGLRRQYNIIKNKIESRSDLDTYKVRSTKAGKTKDYVRVVSKEKNNRQARYAQLDEFGNDDSEIDIEYYMSIIKSSLRSVCSTIGLPDERFVTTMSNVRLSSKSVKNTN